MKGEYKSFSENYKGCLSFIFCFSKTRKSDQFSFLIFLSIPIILRIIRKAFVSSFYKVSLKKNNCFCQNINSWICFSVVRYNVSQIKHCFSEMFNTLVNIMKGKFEVLANSSWYFVNTSLSKIALVFFNSESFMELS